jgi:hypothetical protein
VVCVVCSLGCCGGYVGGTGLKTACASLGPWVNGVVIGGDGCFNLKN